MTSITIKASDSTGSFSAYVAEPASKPAGAVVVIQEIFGINAALRATADWIARMGFIAICPDLFWRLEPGVDITDKTKAEWDKAIDLMNRFDQAKGIEDLKTTLATARSYPGSNGKAGTIGFCLGGRLAFMMAQQSDADCNISYYGVGLEGLAAEVGSIKKPLLIHIAENDEYVPPDARTKILDGIKGNAQIAAHVYPAVNHAFARVNGVNENIRAATIANGRSAELLARTLA